MVNEISQIQLVLVGAENTANTKLLELLRQYKQKHIIQHVGSLSGAENIASRAKANPTILILDLFGFNISHVIETIDRIRTNNPTVVFVLYIDGTEYVNSRNFIPQDWYERFNYFFKIYKVPENS